MRTNIGRCAQMPPRQAGLTIIEIMVALVLGALLMLGLTQIFTSNSQSFRVNEATARAQESGRIATDMLARALRNAGYFACFPANGITNNLDPDGTDYDENLHAFRSEGIFSSNVEADRPDGAIDGTDWFVLSGLSSAGISIYSEGNINSVNFYVNQTADELKDGAVIMISDCNNGDIIQLTQDAKAQGSGEIKLQANSGKGAPGNDFTGNSPPGCSSGANCFSAVYPPGAQILFPHNDTYFIGTGTSGRRALFVINSRTNSGASVELVDGVQNMQVRYGIGTAEAGVNNWETNPNAITNWDSVMATQVSLLVRSGDDALLEDPMSACFPSWADCSAGDNFNAADNALYRIYSFTTTLRNRI